jgi:hypothetical protein
MSAAWNRFWFAAGSPLSLALFRVLFGLVLLAEIPVSESRAHSAIEPGFHLRYWSALPIPSPGAFSLVHVLQIPFAVLVSIGLWTRLSCGALIGLQAFVFFQDVLIFRNHPYFFLLVLGVLMFSPCAEALSVDRWRRERRGRPSEARATLTAQRLLQVQVSWVYLAAGLQKINLDYLNGETLSRLFAMQLGTGSSGFLIRAVFGEPGVAASVAWISEPSHLLVVSWFSVALELALGFALWSQRARPVAMVAGIGFHLSIAFLMEIWTFSAAMIAIYLLFLDPATLPALRERWVAGRVR